MADNELDRLIAGHLDDALTTDDAARLHERLRQDPSARDLLLAAARQATLLPLIAARPVGQRRWRFRFVAVAAAACLVLSALGVWFMLAQPEPVLRTDATGAMASREGRPVNGPWLLSGDILRTAEHPAVLAWTDETTRIELSPGSVCVVERDRGAKRLRLERGGLRADVAHQQPEGGLVILTPFGQVDVVGTRFSVQIGQAASHVAVDHGAVAVRSRPEATPVQLQAGYAATLDGVQVPRPLLRLERPITPAPASVASATTEVTAKDWLADNGSGWEGGLGEHDTITSLATDPDWTRIMPPVRTQPGYARYSDHLTCSITVTVDRPTTLALVLVISQTADSIWQGNLQAERPLPAGTSTITIPVSTMRQRIGFREQLPAECMVATFALMTWNPSTEFRISRVAFDAGR